MLWSARQSKCLELGYLRLVRAAYVRAPVRVRHKSYAVFGEDERSTRSAALRVLPVYDGYVLRLGPYLPVLVMTRYVMTVTLHWYVPRRPAIEGGIKSHRAGKLLSSLLHARCSQSVEDRAVSNDTHACQ